MRKQFCKRGHNISVVGRYKDGKGNCITCTAERGKKNYTPVKIDKRRLRTEPRKQFCPQGHDTFIVGRDKNNYCKQCKKEWICNTEVADRFCIHGHDTLICGRGKKGNCKQCQIEWMINKIKNSIVYKLRKRLRGRIRDAVKGNKRIGSFVKDLGCTLGFLKQYLEVQFYNSITWDNWGKVWELDHITPLWKFDLTNKEEFLKACHYTNLQPLTIEDHKKKSKKDLEDFYKHLKRI